jgi:alpha-tubulin suppressor-like RCC1 family protein
VRAVGSSTLETHARRARKALVVALLLARAPIAAAKKLLLTSDSASCALDDAGLMKCWGGNEYGALGNANLGTGNTNYGSNIYLAPVVVGNGLGEVIDETTHVFNEGDVEVIAGGWLHHCALEREQSGGTKVWCWGYNGYGQVGDGTTTSRKVPVLVREHANGPALTGVSSLVLGWDITCAAMSAGGVMCWGRNEANLGYACGDGDTTVAKKSNPVWVKMSDNSVLQGVVRELYVGQFHSCVLFEDDLDRLVCWGMQTWGIANPGVDPATTTNDGMAREITYFKDRGKRVKSLGLGADHTCALLTTGTVECWGVNNYGQLGVNCGDNSYTPAQVPGLSGVASIDGGIRFTCVIISFTGEVKCWGNNALNQLGSGFLDNYYHGNDPAHCGADSSVANIGTNGNPGARFLAVSWYHTCVTMSDFTIRCWGNNKFGQLGDHQEGESANPHTVGREPVTVLLSTGSPGVNFIAFDTRGACGCCDDMMKAMGFNTDCKA